MKATKKAKRWWVSWWSGKDDGSFTLHSPWWISGERGEDDKQSFCAALIASTPEEAMGAVTDSYDRPHDLEWRFVNERPDDWSPFCDRFKPRKWMQWPEVKP